MIGLTGVSLVNAPDINLMFSCCGQHEVKQHEHRKELPLAEVYGNDDGHRAIGDREPVLHPGN